MNKEDLNKEKIKNKEVKSETVSDNKTEISPQILIDRLKQTLWLLRMEKEAGKLVATHQIKKVKKEIAKILTKLNQTREKIK